MKKFAALVFTLALVIGLMAIPAQAATEEEIEGAIDTGLAWLVDQQDPVDGSWGDWAQVAMTGLAVVKLEHRAFELDYESPFDPAYEYSENVIAGLDYIFGQAAGGPCGVYFTSGWDTYETGIAMMAIAYSGDLDRTVSVGSPVVIGLPYSVVLGANVAYFANSQTAEGGWSYACGEEEADNSNSGYAVLGLSYAETAGIDIPQTLKDNLSGWIDLIQDDVDGDADDGGSWYTTLLSWVNLLKTGNLLFEMQFVGDTAATQRVTDAIDYIERHWSDPNADPGWRPDQYQAMYCLMKGLESFNIQAIEVGGSPIDWYDELADAIIATQDPSGYWIDLYWTGSNVIGTEWALLTLERVVPPIEVQIDIKPWSDPNSINLRSKGVIPVAILTTSTAAGEPVDFDATMVDPATVVFAGASPLRWAIEDVDGDGDMDMILHFATQEVEIECGDTEARLDGETYDGKEFFGIDSVRPICKGGKGG